MQGADNNPAGLEQLKQTLRIPNSDQYKISRARHGFHSQRGKACFELPQAIPVHSSAFLYKVLIIQRGQGCLLANRIDVKGLPDLVQQSTQLGGTIAVAEAKT